MTKREVYYLIFNKHIRDGKFEADSYTLDIESAYQGKVPEKITIVGEKITVLFTDGDRHILNYDQNVEFFDRIVKPKTDAKQTTD